MKNVFERLPGIIEDFSHRFLDVSTNHFMDISGEFLIVLLLGQESDPILDEKDNLLYVDTLFEFH